MRVEINIPDDKKFLDKLQMLADTENRSRKNWLETLVVTTVNNSDVKPIICKHKILRVDCVLCGNNHPLFDKP